MTSRRPSPSRNRPCRRGAVGMTGAAMRYSLAAGVALLAAAAVPGAARADDKSHITILEENDSIYFNSDKHYTQGLRLSYLGPDVQPGDFWDKAFGVFE